MITGQVILKLAAKGALVHRVTRDYGDKLPANLPRYGVNHFATKAQAEKDMRDDCVFNKIVKPVYSTIPAAELAKAPGVGSFFYVLT